MTSVHQKMSRLIQSSELIAGGDRLLVAVSGGPDSVALLYLLCELRDELGLHMEVAHLQHGIRGEDAMTDARFVAALADKLQLPFHLKEVDLPRLKRAAGKGNLEALARAERYGFFADVMQRRELAKVATAHTQDDQAETVVMWLLRGTGTKGLGGMAPLHRLKVACGGSMREIAVVRPLLETSKAELQQYLSDRQLVYRVDRSNQDPTFLRNWIRTALLPQVGRRMDPHVPERLGRVAKIFRDEDALLDTLARSGFAATLTAGGLNRGALLSQPKALQRRMLRLWIEQGKGHLHGIEYVHIDDMLRLIEAGPPQGRLSIPGGWEFVREYDSLKMARRTRDKRQICYNYRLKVGVILRIPEANLEIHSVRLTTPPEVLPDNFMDAVFDLACLENDLSVRNYRPGDRFRPLGLAGRKKIKDLFIEKRVPQSLRSRYPLVIAGEEIVWVPGYGRSAAAVVSRQTSAVLHLKALPN